MGLFSGLKKAVGSVGGAVGSVFGGVTDSFSAPQEKSTTQVQKVNWWNPEQEALFKSLYPTISTGVAGPAPSSPNMYVPRTAEEEAYFNLARSKAVENMATGTVPYEVGPEYAEQYFEQGLRPVYEHEWENTVLPGIQEQYAGSTFASTGRDEAVRKATQEFGLGMAKEKAGLIYGEEQAKRAAIDAAYGRVSAGQGLTKEAAAYSRQIESEKVMNDIQKFLMGEEVNGEYNPAFNPMVALAFNLLGLQEYGYTGVTKSESTGGGLGYGATTGASSGIGTAFGSWLFK